MTVILFDLETTGLPNSVGLKFGEYHHHERLDKYDSSRIVQMSYMVCDDHLNCLSTHDAVINANDEFKISNSEFHGITDEISRSEGRPFRDVMIEFADALQHATIVMAHNADFDVNVLKSELFRIDLGRVLDQFSSKRVICTMKSSMDVVNARNMYGRKKYPSLKELYTFAVKKPMMGAHDASFDVANMHEAVKTLHDLGLFVVHGSDTK